MLWTAYLNEFNFNERCTIDKAQQQQQRNRTLYGISSRNCLKSNSYNLIGNSICFPNMNTNFQIWIFRSTTKLYRSCSNGFLTLRIPEIQSELMKPAKCIRFVRYHQMADLEDSFLSYVLQRYPPPITCKVPSFVRADKSKSMQCVKMFHLLILFFLLLLLLLTLFFASA